MVAPRSPTPVGHKGSKLWAELHLHEEDHRLRDLKYAYNASVPINRMLPPEVLSEIFSHLPSPLPTRRQHPHTPYLLVYRAWYSLLLHTPQFWAAFLSRPRILTDKGWETGLYDRLYLERSGTVPLSLSLDNRTDRAFPSLILHRHHITSLRIGITVIGQLGSEPDLSLLNSLLNAGLSLLAELDVYHIHLGGSRPKGSLIFHSQQLPRLRSLTQPWTTTAVGDAVAQLRHLHLEGCAVCDVEVITPAFDMTSILNKMTRSPLLESLSLSHRGTAGPSEDHPIPVWGDDVKPVICPALTRLDTRNCHPTITSTVLSKLVHRPTCRVWLAAKSLHESLPAGPFTATTMADHVNLELKYDAREHAALSTYIDGSKALSFSFKPEPGTPNTQRALWTCWGSMSKTFSDANAVTTLTFRGLDGCVSPNYGPRDGEKFGELLKVFPTLLRLDFLGWDCRQWLIDILDGLNLCPRMRKLTVCWQRIVDTAVLTSDVLKKAHPAAPRDDRLKRPLLGAVVFEDFCDRVACMLRNRAELGSPLRSLTVQVAREITSSYADDEEWDPPALKGRMWRKLEGLVEKLEVSYADEV
ncbi:hypothetical protein L226DRAFT_617085 [Lentinus tigrinus ALCF2SS1-7]|uniref:F-box domain-containing protein n=1 Tax=Lentinus tigrinus ALCF2SS1-6 TaxID=1328759 RepID=A0A5C2RXB4_9APHY|nr:hypothetical protein L227DRAFT_615098 [Lentinus tigrinus ALCF2SS1-6]RPD69105.1 hypothetical protein L226DRAFT_617085 [Lentinus tigrinus ALCF2SS1-7]